MKMKKIIVLRPYIFAVLISMICSISFSQNLGINNTGSKPHPSALFDIDTSPNDNAGFLMPRLTTAKRLAILNPANGLLVYDTNLKGIYVFDGSWDCLNTPAGTIQYFANTSNPRGYLICDGRAVSRTQYPELFNAIGTLYGSGNGTTTFNIPDLRGEFIRGIDNGRGIDIGRVLGSNQIDLFKNHSHSMATPNGLPQPGQPLGRELVFPGGNQQGIDYVDTYGPIPTDVTGGTETRPRNIALLPCIKY